MPLERLKMLSKEDKKFLDSLDDELLISFICMSYGTTLPIWERCSKEEYYDNVPMLDGNIITTKWLMDYSKYLFSDKEYRRVPLYRSRKGGLLDQINGLDPDDYYYEKRIGSKFALMLGNDMIEYCQTRKCMEPFFKSEN